MREIKFLREKEITILFIVDINKFNLKIEKIFYYIFLPLIYLLGFFIAKNNLNKYKKTISKIKEDQLRIIDLKENGFVISDDNDKKFINEFLLLK